MKQIKKMLVMLSSLALCIVSLLGTSMPVQAEGTATTYYVKYVSDANVSDWRFQTGGWTEGGYHRELYYLLQDIKDGDKLVIQGNGEKTLFIDTKVNLGEVTFFGTTGPVVSAKSIDTVYGIFGSTFAVNGDVKNAYLYENCTCNFNNNVSYLEITNTDADNIEATVFVVGTVDHAKSVGATKTHFELYNFVASSFTLHDGALYTKQEQCSQTPIVATPEPVAPTVPATPSTPSTPSSELDEVPKTADIRFNPLWLVGVAAVCLAGSYALKKEN